jgi:hypothetical protein
MRLSFQGKRRKTAIASADLIHVIENFQTNAWLGSILDEAGPWAFEVVGCGDHSRE